MTHTKKRIITFLFIFLLGFLALPTSSSAASPFIDVKTTNPNYKAIEWAFKIGITKGYPNGKFAPNDKITEAHFVSMLIRYDSSSPDSFPASNNVNGNYQYLQQYHFQLPGITNTSSRNLPIQRGNAATMIANFRGLDLSEPQAIQYLYINDLATGITGKNNYQDFRPNTSMTRGEAVQLLHRLSKEDNDKLIGLNKNPTGSDNRQFLLPVDFMGDSTVTFDPPEVNIAPPLTGQPDNKDIVDIDIEKPTLIANGVDSTFVTISMKSCSGSDIPYENSLSSSVASAKGATVSQSNERELPSKPTSTSAQSDGGDITVKVTAPRAKEALNDNISFNIDTKSLQGMDCYTEPITVQLNYVPQAELRLETFVEKELTIKATIVLPGGEILYNYNGSVQFRSAEGARFANDTVNFVNGVAWTTVTPPASSQPIIDVISARIDRIDTRYTTELGTIANANHRIETLYEAPLSKDASCSIEDAEVAFILDASGSMLRNDPDKLRESKSVEFITALQAPQNISTKFNSWGKLLRGPDTVTNVKPTLINVGQSGGTNIGDGLEKAFGAYNGTGPRIAILLTDGRSGEKKIEEMIKLAIKEDIRVFTIGLGNSKQLNDKLLIKLAQQTGGTYYHVEKDIDIGTAYQSIFTAITCGIPMPSCTNLSQAFSEPTLEFKSTQFYMHTFVRERCGEIERVVLRLKSVDGDIDYDLVYRGQDYFALKKGINEITNFDLYKEGIFLAYDREGKLVGERRVQMTP